MAHLQALAAQGCCGEVNAPEAVFIPESLPSQDRIALWKTLTQCVNDDELKTLCFTLHENYDNLGGETLEGHIRELILRMERKGRLHILIAACQERYPHQQWPGVAVSHAAPTFAVLSIADLARNFGQELRALKQQGFIAEDAAIPGGWRVRPLVFLWWLTDAAGLLPTGAQPLIEAAAREGTGR